MVDMIESSFVKSELHVDTGALIEGWDVVLEDVLDEEVVETDPGAGYRCLLPAEPLSALKGGADEFVEDGPGRFSFLRFGVALKAYVGAADVPL